MIPTLFADSTDLRPMLAGSCNQLGLSNLKVSTGSRPCAPLPYSVGHMLYPSPSLLARGWGDGDGHHPDPELLGSDNSLGAASWMA